MTVLTESIHSDFLSAGLFRELVIYYADQCYPEYLVLYQRVHQSETERRVAVS